MPRLSVVPVCALQIQHITADHDAAAVAATAAAGGNSSAAAGSVVEGSCRAGPAQAMLRTHCTATDLAVSCREVIGH